MEEIRKNPASLIKSTFQQAIDSLATDYKGSSLTDIFIVVDKESGEVAFYDDEENIIDSDEEIIRWIVEDLNKYNLKGIYLQKNDFCFYIYSYDGGILEYRIEKKQDINNISEKIGISKSDKEMKFKESKSKLNFCKDYDKPTYDIFDDKKLDEIVENIFNEIKSYMDIIVKELN